MEKLFKIDTSVYLLNEEVVIEDKDGQGMEQKKPKKVILRHAPIFRRTQAVLGCLGKNS